MLLDQRPLLMRQSTGLRDHGLRHGKQSDVMHEAGQCEPLEFLSVIAQPRTDLRRQNADVHQIRDQDRPSGARQSLHDELIVTADRIGDLLGHRRQLGHLQSVLALDRRGERGQLLFRPPIDVCGSSFFHVGLSNSLG